MKQNLSNTVKQAEIQMKFIVKNCIKFTSTIDTDPM